MSKNEQIRRLEGLVEDQARQLRELRKCLAELGLINIQEISFFNYPYNSTTITVRPIIKKRE